MAIPTGYYNPRMQAMPLKGPQYAGDTPPIIANPGGVYGGSQSMAPQAPIQAMGGTTPQPQMQTTAMPQQQFQPAPMPVTAQMRQPTSNLRYGLGGAEEALSGALGGALGFLQRAGQMPGGGGGVSISIGGGGGGGGVAPADFSNAGVNEAIDQGAAGFSPYTQHGGSAYQQQAALSGALGHAAQKAAMAGFQESPGQAFLREQAERSLLRNQAAIGGLGGGRVMQELQRQAIGMAAQDFENQFNRLGQVTGTGMQAAGQLGQLRGQQASLAQGLNIARGQAESQANIAASNNAMQAGIAQANIAADLQRSQMDIGSRMALAAAQMHGDIGGQLAGYRMRTGEQIAGNTAATSSALADLIRQQSGGLSQIVGTNAGNIASLLQGYGSESAQSQQQLAAILANLATGQGSQVAGLPSAAGLYQTPNYMGMTSNLLGGIGNVITAMNQNSAPAGNTPGIMNAFPRGGY